MTSFKSKDANAAWTSKNQNSTSLKTPNGIVEIVLYIHIPPKFDGIEEDHDDCMGCKKSLMPSTSYHQVHLCENAVGFCGRFGE